jgi:hypothetical protein
MKRLIMFLAVILLFLFIVPSSNSKDIPTGWSCRCTTCGKSFTGQTPTYTCDYDNGACICARTIVKL